MGPCPPPWLARLLAEGGYGGEGENGPRRESHGRQGSAGQRRVGHVPATVRPMIAPRDREGSVRHETGFRIDAVSLIRLAGVAGGTRVLTPLGEVPVETLRR